MHDFLTDTRCLTIAGGTEQILLTVGAESAARPAALTDFSKNGAVSAEGQE